MSNLSLFAPLARSGRVAPGYAPGAAAYDPRASLSDPRFCLRNLNAPRAASTSTMAAIIQMLSTGMG